MADEQRVLSVKISTIRETLVKLGKSIKTQSGVDDCVPEFSGFSPVKSTEVAAATPKRTRAFTDENEQLGWKPDDFQVETTQIVTRSRGDSLKNISAERTYQGAEGNRSDFISRDKRDQVDSLLQRITDKDRLLRDQSIHLVQIQEQLDTLRNTLAQAKLDHEREVAQLEEEIQREKRLRIQVENQLKNAVLSEETKIQQKLKSSFNGNEKTWKSDLEALQAKLEETNKVKVTLMSSNAELYRHLQRKDFDILKLKEEMREKLEIKKGGEDRDESQIGELKMVQKEAARLRKENDELRQSHALLDPSFQSPSPPQSPPQPLPSDLDYYQSRISKLEHELSTAKSENENLYLELSSRPTYKQIREKEQEIATLREENCETSRRRALNFGSPADHHLRKCKEKRKSESDSKDSFAVGEVMKALQATSQSDIIPKIEQLSKGFHMCQKLVSRLAGLVQECSPKHAYGQPPSCKEIWAWTRHLAEEYMLVKRSMETQKENAELVTEMLEMLGLTYPTELPTGLNKLLEENNALNSLQAKVKTRLDLSQRTSLDELLAYLSSDSKSPK